MSKKTNWLGRAFFTGVVCALSSGALARAPIELPEPSMLSLIGVAVVGGIVVYRISRKK